MPLTQKNGGKEGEQRRDVGLRSTDTDTDTAIRHGGTRGHGKFKKTRIRIRQGHGIIR